MSIKRNKKAYVLLTALIFLLNGKIKAQDFHLSQNHIFPMTVNPAQTGLMTDDLRFSAIQRQQWGGLGALFKTTAMNAELSLKDGILGPNRKGLGIGFFQDELGGNRMMRQSILLTGAYEITLDKARRQHLSFGLQLNYELNRIATEDLRFESQYDYYAFNPLLNSGEVLGESRTKLNTHAGVQWRYRIRENIHYTSAFSAYNLLNMRYAFTEQGAKGRALQRFNLHQQVRIYIGKRLILSPTVLTMHQAGENLWSVGGESELNFGKYFGLYMGSWWRAKDAVIYLAGLRLKNIQLRASYDMGYSSLGLINQTENINPNSRPDTFEFSVVYSARIFKSRPKAYTVPCETF